ATLAVADGDYTIALPVSGRDEVGRLEVNFTAMTRQLGSALAAERQRATGDARAAERASIAREIHDAISQHLFALRMIAAGMRRADPGNQQARVIERISEEALRDMQALLIELRPDGPDGAGHAVLAVRDTGTGFDPAAPHTGSGLTHIRDRAAELGGTAHIDSAPGRGAALTVRVPVP